MWWGRIRGTSYVVERRIRRPKTPVRSQKTVGKWVGRPYVFGVKSARSIYRRRRLGALFVAVAGAFALYAGTGADAVTQPVSYTVSPGDTLWDIAVAHTSPDADPRPTVEIIRETNDLPGTTIRPGMRLELPPDE